MNFKLYGYKWKIDFVGRDNKELGDSWGVCLNYKMKILIRKDLEPQVLKECIVHELTHAAFLVQGRNSSAKFGIEDICEFIGFCGETIINLANEIFKKYEQKRNLGR